MVAPLLITPKTKIYELLEAFPQLEEDLIALAPQFENLKNPFLRKTIARITTLQQASIIGNIPIEKMINQLRFKVGQNVVSDINDIAYENDTQPEWFREELIIKTLDARTMLEKGENPLGIVLQEIKELKSNQVYELITGFVPAPLIEKVQEKGYKVWIRKKSDIIVSTMIFLQKE